MTSCILGLAHEKEGVAIQVLTIAFSSAHKGISECKSVVVPWLLQREPTTEEYIIDNL